jgi:D-arabinose 1-dehydrogenase-like Zn-dependent alcohol dehydrogenase
MLTDILVSRHERLQLHGGNKLPLTGSHEAVGIVHEMGPDVDTSRLNVGDRVGTLNYYQPCGTLVR